MRLCARWPGGMTSGMKTFLALLAVGFICTGGMAEEAPAPSVWLRVKALVSEKAKAELQVAEEVQKVAKELAAEERLKEAKALVERAEQIRADAAFDKFVEEQNRRDEKWIDERVAAQDAANRQWEAARRAAPTVQATPAPQKFHRRFSSHSAEDAYVAGRLPEYQAAMAAEAARAELIEAQRRTAEEVERLRRAVESRRR